MERRKRIKAERRNERQESDGEQRTMQRVGSRGEGARNTLSREPKGARAVSKWLAVVKSPQSSAPQQTAGDGVRLPGV